MSDCLEPVSAKPLPQPTEARAARLKKFEREQLIVDYLNRGVSVAEIAARVGVGEKRMRAIMRDPRTGIRGLARRMPQPPMEFVAIQVSRLNEALLVAFSAMSPSNLKAVDQVVKIVRELDRYGGAFAAEWARPEAPRLDAPAEEDVAFAKAWLSSGDDRPENLAQSPENIESAPGNPLALQSPSGDGRPSTPYEREEARPGLAPPPPLWGKPPGLTP
jgi:transposase-like protein